MEGGGAGAGDRVEGLGFERGNGFQSFVYNPLNIHIEAMYYKSVSS